MVQGKGEENFKADLKPFNDALHAQDDWFSDLKEQQKPGLKSLDLDKLKARVLRGPRKETSIVYLW